MVVGWALTDLSGFSLSHTLLYYFPCYISFFTIAQRVKKRSSVYPTSPPYLFIHYRAALASSRVLKGWIFINCWGYNYRALYPFLLPLSLRRGKQWNILAIRVESLSMQPSNCDLHPAQIASPCLLSAVLALPGIFLKSFCKIGDNCLCACSHTCHLPTMETLIIVLIMPIPPPFPAPLSFLSRDMKRVTRHMERQDETIMMWGDGFLKCYQSLS